MGIEPPSCHPVVCGIGRRSTAAPRRESFPLDFQENKIPACTCKLKLPFGSQGGKVIPCKVSNDASVGINNTGIMK